MICAAPLISMLALAGCAVAETVPDAAGRVAENGTTMAPEPAPAAAGAPTLSQDVMYKLLVAEFAGREGDVQLALDNYMEVARALRDPDVAERATRIAVFGRDEERGLEAARLWAEIDPESIEARQVYATILLRTEDLDGASVQMGEIVERLEATDPGRGYAMVGELLAREKNRRNALIVMERVVGRSPDDPRAQFAFGTLLVRHGQLERAIGVFDRVLELDPDNESALVLKARILRQQGDTAAAIELLDTALQAKPDADGVRLAYARLLVDAKRYDEARDQFVQLSEKDPSNADVRYALGLLLVQTNRPDEAEVQFRELVKVSEHREAAWFYLGQIAEAGKRYEEAIEAYRKVDRGEHRLNAQIRVALLLAETGAVDRARAHLHGLRAESSREAVRIYRAEAEILVRLERLEDALEVYDAAIGEFPRNTDLLYARAMLAEKLDRLELLERDLRDILSREPNNADALNALGYTLADRTDRLDEAHDLIKRAYELKPEDHYVVDSMGWVLYRMGSHQEALKHLRRAMKLNPDPEVAAHLGEVLWVMGNQTEALEVWDTALKATPDDKKLLDTKRRFGH